MPRYAAGGPTEDWAAAARVAWAGGAIRATASARRHLVQLRLAHPVVAAAAAERHHEKDHPDADEKRLDRCVGVASLGGEGDEGAARRGRLGAHEDGEEADVDLDAQAMRQSEAVRDAMKNTAVLWSRTAQPWPESAVDKSASTIQEAVQKSEGAQKEKKKQREEPKPRTYQARAYVKWKETVRGVGFAAPGVVF